MQASRVETEGHGLYVYEPFSATPTALAVYAAGTAIAWAGNYYQTEQSLPWAEPMGDLGLIATLLLALAPLVVALQLGWSYVLTSDSLRVLRFGRERFSVPLDEYLGGASRFGVFQLRFTSRSVWIIETAKDDRQRFIARLSELAERSRVEPTSPVSVGSSGEVEVTLDQLSFGRNCLACGERHTDEVELCVRRGFDIGYGSVIEWVLVRVPVCDQHARAYALWKHGVWLVYLGLGSALTLWFMATWEHPDLALAFMTGCLFAGLAFIPFHRMWWHRLRDWKSLGIRATKLHADLRRATFACATAEIRERLVSAATSNERIDAAGEPSTR